MISPIINTYHSNASALLLKFQLLGAERMASALQIAQWATHKDRSFRHAIAYQYGYKDGHRALVNVTHGQKSAEQSGDVDNTCTWSVCPGPGGAQCHWFMSQEDLVSNHNNTDCLDAAIAHYILWLDGYILIYVSCRGNVPRNNPLIQQLQVVGNITANDRAVCISGRLLQRACTPQGTCREPTAVELEGLARDPGEDHD